MNWDETGPETDEPTGPVFDDRLVDADADGEDTAVEAALRPKDLEEFVGQEKVREQLDLVLKAARARGATADHVLLSGAPGLGKTTLSMIIAAEMNAPIRITSGPAIQHAGDLAAILSSLQEGRSSSWTRSTACPGPPRRCSTWRWRTSASTSSSAKAPAPPPSRSNCPRSPWSAPPPGPGCSRPAARPLRLHRPHGVLRPRRAGARRPPLGPPPGRRHRRGRRSRDRRTLAGHPRIANRLLRRVRDYAQVKAEGAIDREIAAAALKVYEVDARGLDRLDRAVLGALLKLFGGGPVGLSTLAVAVGRNARPSRRSPSPSSYGKGCWPGRRAGGWPPRPPGPTWDWFRRPTA